MRKKQNEEQRPLLAGSSAQYQSIEDDLPESQPEKKPFSDLITKANATLEELVSMVNGEIPTVATKSVVGRLIESGKIGIFKHNQRVCAVGAGRWLLGRTVNRAEWVGEYALTDEKIQVEQLTVVRVQKGQVAYATNKGVPLIL